MATEARNPRSTDLGNLPPVDVIALMEAEEARVLVAVAEAREALAETAERVAAAIDRHRVFLLGAGTSGRLAMGEAAEMPPTFGIPDGVFVPIIASGRYGGAAAVTADEDDERAGPAALDDHGCGPGDIVIGLAASGTTPFVVAGVVRGRDRGAWTCGITNNRDTALLAAAHHRVLLETGPEVLTGSTRLKAGTAQKLALNRITTAAMVRAGRVVENLMVEVQPATAKLRQRCVRIVVELTGASEAEARARLERNDWRIRAALAGPDTR